MKIIGVMGAVGTGKDSLKDYIAKKYKYHPLKLGGILREEAILRGIKVSRPSLYKLGDELKKTNPNILAKRALEKARKKKWEKIVISDVRTDEDVSYLRKFRAKFIRVDADLEIRFKRIKKRGRRGDPKTLAEFEKLEKKEIKKFGLKNVFKLADYVIINNYGYKQLYREADKLMGRIK